MIIIATICMLIMAICFTINTTILLTDLVQIYSSSGKRFPVKNQLFIDDIDSEMQLMNHKHLCCAFDGIMKMLTGLFQDSKDFLMNLSTATQRMLLKVLATEKFFENGGKVSRYSFLQPLFYLHFCF